MKKINSKKESENVKDAFLSHIGADGKERCLRDHLQSVSELAGRNAAAFTDKGWAQLAGVWHDLGKYRQGFQTYIRQAQDENAHIEGRVSGADKTHSAAGACWAQQFLEDKYGQEGDIIGRVLSYVIAGHHAGLDNWFEGLNERLEEQRTKNEFSDTMNACPPDDILKPAITHPSTSSIPIDNKEGQPPGAFALWVRMLFSALVDADFLDTEQFLDAEKFAERQGYPALASLTSVFDKHMEDKMNDLKACKMSDTLVNQQRAKVLKQCREKAVLPPGVFTLTVPTGGGKTLSSMAFAIEHARKHNKRRIIYAIPYTSIIEQTADTFRNIFSEANIVETPQ